MAPPPRPRPLRKDTTAGAFKNKPILFSETFKASTLVPNIKSVTWSPTGSMVAHSTGINIRAWNPDRPDVKNSTELRENVGKNGAHGSVIERLQFNPRNEGLLASTAADGLVKLWDVRLPGGGTGIVAGGGTAANKGGVTPKAGEHKIGDKGLFLTWHPNGTELLAGRHDDVVMALDIRRSNVAIFDTASASNTTRYDMDTADRTPIKGKGNFNQMTFSNSGREVFATTSEGPVKILDYPSMNVLHTLYAHSSSTYSVQMSPTGNFLAVGGSDSLITLWDTTSWLATHVLTNHTCTVKDLSFSFDGNYLVAGSGTDGQRDGDKGLHIYHVDTGEMVHTVETANAPRDVAWHPLRYAVAYSGDPGGLKLAGAMT
ncbi:hypothetical protein M409DRAFT_63715 [Zasmidium cellare ATCC 36951]|uniref:Anaphase-promoting complex subunit 4 WD40 domain-containing protein n=1 Tax=Zasmidium cellare ATCC 36951 TaxID=1080233 RepID=A0A6A6CWG2_ZASCE|nr:uncharacterized protein M409DRAFT_63715 [Zasmidium cellare ATCC 36951]KAF2171441.1 hypothetical protein M409DRAFT_63715 [Zasmidium cellare ATCC 36951]